MGWLYKGRDTRLDRLVAIRQSVTEFSDRFERGARAIAALNHPNVCQVGVMAFMRRDHKVELVATYHQSPPAAPPNSANR